MNWCFDLCVESRCFGFIEFMSGVDTVSLIQDLPHIIDGKEVECKLAVPKNPPKDDKKRKKKKKKILEEIGSPESLSPQKSLIAAMRINAAAFEMKFESNEVSETVPVHLDLQEDIPSPIMDDPQID